jgi:hypothetical protein
MLYGQRFFVVSLALLCCACGDDGSGPVVGLTCNDIGIPSLLIEIRDQHGKATAPGAAVLAEKGSRTYSQEGFDSLSVFIHAQNQGGTFDVWVFKPWHAPAVVPRVAVPEGPCGVSEPVRVPVTLSLDPRAPPIRQVVLPPTGFHLQCGLGFTLRAHLEADPDAPRDIVWESHDPDFVSVSQTGRVTAECRNQTSETWVVAMAAGNRSVRDSVRVGAAR